MTNIQKRETLEDILHETVAQVRSVEDAATTILALRSNPQPQTGEVLITPEALQEHIRSAYLAGAGDVHTNYQPDPDPDFGEASYDYVASLDFTETTRPSRSNPQPGSEGYRLVPVEPTEAMTKAGHDAAYYQSWIGRPTPASLNDVFRAYLAASPTPPTAQPGEVERLREARDAVLALAASVVRGVAAEKRNQGEKQSALNYAARRIEDLRARAALTPSES